MMLSRLSLLPILAVLLYACAGAGSPGGELAAPDTAPAEITQAASLAEGASTGAAPSPQDSHPAIWAAWQSGPHAAGYDIGKGPNTYCARCHSPANWDPQAVVDPPPNCVSCKFPNQPEPIIAAGNPLIPEDEWQGVGCATCHPPELGPALAWQNLKTGYTEMPATPTDLCEKCHQDTKTLRHRRTIGEGAHAGYTCTGCHDPHTTAANCSAEGCHADRPASPGHTPEHEQVACGACHDASGLDVGPAGDEARWSTFHTVSVAGRASVKELQAHNLQRQVECGRCHFPGNPWGLATEVDRQK